MLISGAACMRRAVRVRLLQAQRAALHNGAATPEDTQVFVEESGAPEASVKLRVGSDKTVSITRRGLGSPHLWAKDVPRIDAGKHAVASFQSNFIQASINPHVQVSKKLSDKQAYIEALVIQEAVEEDDIPREAMVVAAILEDSLVNPSSADPTSRVDASTVENGLAIALKDLDLATLDHLTVRIPDEFLLSDKYRPALTETLHRVADTLESLCQSSQLQSFGFALPSTPLSADSLKRVIETSLLPVAENHSNLASLQLQLHPFTNGPLDSSVRESLQSRGILLIADKVFEASLANGKPLALRTYSGHLGEDVALLLKSAFNLAISIERSYMEKVLPNNSHLRLPSAEEVAWAHILANQHSQFDNLEEWVFIRESQILPRFYLTLKEFEQDEKLKEFGFAYSMAIRELLKCFTASVELADASRADSILVALQTAKLIDGETTLEQATIRATLSAGADVVLFQEQLGKDGTADLARTFSHEQLRQLGELAAPFLKSD